MPHNQRSQIRQSIDPAREAKVPVTSSLKVAEVFRKLHKDVIKAIENLEITDDFLKRNFALKSYPIHCGNGAVRLGKAYDLTEEGFTFLVMGFTGAKAALMTIDAEDHAGVNVLLFNLIIRKKEKGKKPLGCQESNAFILSPFLLKLFIYFLE